METLRFKLILTGASLVLTLVSGLLLSRSGRPLNPVLFNVHKIISVVMIIVAVLVARGFFKAGNAAGPEVTMLIVTGLLFLSLVVTGGLLSVDLKLPAIVLRIHQVAPLVSLASAAFTVFLMYRRLA